MKGLLDKESVKFNHEMISEKQEEGLVSLTVINKASDNLLKRHK